MKESKGKDAEIRCFNHPLNLDGTKYVFDKKWNDSTKQVELFYQESDKVSGGKRCPSWVNYKIATKEMIHVHARNWKSFGNPDLTLEDLDGYRGFLDDEPTCINIKDWMVHSVKPPINIRSGYRVPITTAKYPRIGDAYIHRTVGIVFGAPDNSGKGKCPNDLYCDHREEGTDQKGNYQGNNVHFIEQGQNNCKASQHYTSKRERSVL
jgi:hypothetical protein